MTRSRSAKRSAKNKKAPPAMAVPSMWVPGQGLVRASDQIIQLSSVAGQFIVGFAIDREWWCVFEEVTRRCLSDGWPTERAAKSWCESSLEAAIR